MRDFVVFGMGRSGSTLLASLLNAHPSIHCDGEILSPVYWHRRRRPLRLPMLRYPLFYIRYRQLVAQYRHGASVYGFKLFLVMVTY